MQLEDQALPLLGKSPAISPETTAALAAAQQASAARLAAQRKALSDAIVQHHDLLRYMAMHPQGGKPAEVRPAVV